MGSLTYWALLEFVHVDDIQLGIQVRADFKLDDWRVRPQFGRIERGDETVHLKPKSMAVLECLAAADGNMVTRNELLDTVWPNMVVTDDVLTQSVVELRKALGDSVKAPKFIETIPKSGFRLIPAIGNVETEAEPSEVVLEVRPGDSIVARMYQRKMFRIAAGYLAVAWVLWEVVTATCPTFECSNAFQQSIFWFLVAGLPITLAVAWVNWRTAILVGVGILAGALVMFFVMRGTLPTVQPEPAVTTTPTESPARQPVLAIEDIRSVAVLAFVDRSAESGNEYFSDGLSEELINRLGRVPGLRVPSRTSAFAFKGKDIDLRTIGAELGVDSVLEGSVRKDGGRLRIAAQLVSVTDGYQIWSEIYDRRLDDIFAIQADIAQAIVAAVAVDVSEESLSKLVEPQTSSVEAYDLYILGKHHLKPGGIERSKEYFERAIEIDPNFASAYAALAIANVAELHISLDDQGEETIRELQTNIERALALNPELGEAHRMLALFNGLRGDLTGWEAAARRAVELDPNLVDGHVTLGLALWHQGRFREALKWAEHAMTLDLLHADVMWPVAEILAGMGRTGEATALLRRALDAGLHPFTGHEWLVLIAGYYGKLDEQVQWARRWVADQPSSPTALAALGAAYTRLGDFGVAAGWIDEASSVGPKATLLKHADLLAAQQKYAELVDLMRAGVAAREASGVNLVFYQFLPLAFAGTAETLAGNHHQAVHYFERAFDYVETMVVHNLMNLTMLAYAYRELGDIQKTEATIAKAMGIVDNARAQGMAEFPPLSISIARLHALKGERTEALVALEQAVADGWRDYYAEVGNPIWRGYADDETYRRLMAEVKADIDRMRDRVRQNDWYEDPRSSSRGTE